MIEHVINPQTLPGALERESVKTLGNGMMHEHTYDAAGRETLLRNLKADGSALAAYTTGARWRGSECEGGEEPR